jgi:hypothetical protein
MQLEKRRLHAAPVSSHAGRASIIETASLPRAFVSLIENREGVIVDNVREGTFYLRQTRAVDEISNRVGFVIRHLFEDMEN